MQIKQSPSKEAQSGTTVKISHMQLTAILVISMIFTMTTAVPGFDEYNMERFLSLTITSILMLLLYFPLIIFTKKNQEGALTVVPVAFKWIFGCAILIRLLYTALITALKLKFFVTKTVMPYLSPSIFVIILFLGALYGTHKGIQATGRIAPISLFMYLLFIVLVSFLVWEKLDIIRIYTPFGGDNDFFSEAFMRALRGDQIFFFAVLSGFVRGQENTGGKTDSAGATASAGAGGLAYRSALYYIPIVLIVELWLNFLYNGMFGRALSYMLYPLHTVSSFASFNLIERMDGLFVTMSIIAGLLKITLAFICIRAVLSEIIGLKHAGPDNLKQTSSRIAKITSSILLACVAVTVYFLIGHEQQIIANWKKDWVKIIFGVLVVLVSIIMPITALIFTRKNNEKNSQP